MKTIFYSLASVLAFGVASGSDSSKKESQKISVLSAVRNSSLPRVQGEFLVTVREEFKNAPLRAPAIQNLLAQGGKVVKVFRSSPTVLIKMPDAESSARFADSMRRLSADKSVANIEANTKLKTLVVPNDDRFNELYALNNIGQTGGREGVDIDAPQAWEETTGSKDVLVGIIDTGLDYLHPDLADNAWINPGESGFDENGVDKSKNGIDDDKNGYIDDFRGWDFVNNDNNPMDDQGHGTHTAGTIGAKGNNRIGISGVNWNVSLVGLKFLGADGSGTLDGAVEAIEYATTIGVKLTSNSWGGGGFSQTMESAIQEAAEKGILFVAAAGNEVNDNDANPTYPASYQIDNVISVAATDHNDGLAYFSNFGKKSVHLAAPGVDILSTTPGGKYEELSGTSMACPHVSGAAALLWAKFPELDYKAVKSRLLNNVTSISSVSANTVAAGRLSLPMALETDEVSPAQVPGTSLDSVGLFSANISWGISGDDARTGRARAYEIRFQSSTGDAEPSTSSWDTAEVIATVPDVASATRIEYLIDGVSDDFQGYVAVRAIDNVGNMGAFSEPAFVQFAERIIVSSVDADSAEGVKFEGKWGVEEIEGRGLVFSDSPQGDYDSNANSSLVLPAVNGDFSKETYLSFFASYNLEPRYDFGIVEMRAADSLNWTQLAKFNGRSDWKKEIIKVPSTLAGSDAVQIRFRLTSDSSVALSGVLIDNVSLIQAP